jgi:hypothetical protein
MGINIRVGHGDGIHYWQYRYNKSNPTLKIGEIFAKKIDEIQCINWNRMTGDAKIDFTLQRGDSIELCVESDDPLNPEYSTARINQIVCKAKDATKDEAFVPFILVSWQRLGDKYAPDGALYSARSINGKV